MIAKPTPNEGASAAGVNNTAVAAVAHNCGATLAVYCRGFMVAAR